jgi:hypothetical protein
LLGIGLTPESALKGLLASEQASLDDAEREHDEARTRVHTIRAEIYDRRRQGRLERDR